MDDRIIRIPVKWAAGFEDIVFIQFFRLGIVPYLVFLILLAVFLNTITVPSILNIECAEYKPIDALGAYCRPPKQLREIKGRFSGKSGTADFDGISENGILKIQYRASASPLAQQTSKAFLQVEISQSLLSLIIPPLAGLL